MASWMNESSFAFLEKYLNNASPTGYEASGQQIFLEFLKPYIDEWHLDNYGTVYGVVNPGMPYKVVIEAHADEISWYVNYISEDGFIHVIRNGGSDHLIAPSKKVNIHTPKGIVKGVFGWPAIHTRNGKDDPSPTIENIFIDVGAKDKDEVLEMGVHVGCVITFEDTFSVLNDKYLVGRALDNRLGGYCIAQVAKMLKDEKYNLPFSLYIVNSVQEEIGLRGAEMIADTIKPDIAIIIDVTHDTLTPLLKPKKLGSIKSGDGPVLTYAPAVQRNLLELLISTAEQHNIPFQRSASSRSTGTDTDAFAYKNGGIPSVLISIPLRYMHTTVEMAHKDDVENVIKLMLETVKSIQAGQSFKYF